MEYGSVEKDGSGDLDADWLADGWVALLRKWLADAEHAGVAEPNAMVVGTVDARGRPVHPLCAVQERGRRPASPSSPTTTPTRVRTWPRCPTHRRRSRGSCSAGRSTSAGPVTKVSAEQTADYWSKRPRGSQLGAWASHQSQPIASRAALLAQLADVTARFADLDEVPVPPNWGGYLIAPEVVEFWQGRENRVHNRIRYWTDPELPVTVHNSRIERLQP